MIRFLNDETVGGYRFGKGAIASFDPAVERALIAQGDAILSHLPLLVSQSYKAVPRSSDNSTDTNFVVLASQTVPGGTMNENGELVVTQDWRFTGSTNTKALAMDWNGANVSAPSVNTASIVRANYRIAIKNLNSQSSQSIFGNTTYGLAANDSVGTANTADDVVIDHKCRWTANVVGEQIILLGYSIWYYPGTT